MYSLLAFLGIEAQTFSHSELAFGAGIVHIVSQLTFNINFPIIAAEAVTRNKTERERRGICSDFPSASLTASSCFVSVNTFITFVQNGLSR